MEALRRVSDNRATKNPASAGFLGTTVNYDRQVFGAPDGVKLSLEWAVISRFVLVRTLRYQQKYHQVLTAWGFNHLKTAAAMVSRIPKRRAL